MSKKKPKYCPECGKETKETSKFCDSCGYKLVISEIIEDKERLNKIQQEFMDKNNLLSSTIDGNSINKNQSKQAMKTSGDNNLSIKTIP